MNIGISFSLSQREKDRLASYMKQELLKQMTERIVNSKGFIQALIQTYIKGFLLSSPEVAELKNNTNSIQFALGVLPEEVDKTFEAVVDRISNSLYFDIQSKKDSITLELGMVKDDYLDLISIPQAHFISTGKLGVVIPWLDWLLRSGDRIIFSDYHVKYLTKSNPVSRTKFALMIKPGPFRIPPELSGTETNNLITRALSNIYPLIAREIDRVVL